MSTGFEEPPELFSSDGEKIVIHRDGAGNFFSNHPEYPVRLALHQEAKAREAAAQKAEAERRAAEESDDIDDEGGPSEDDGDGEVDYEEMTAKDLVALARDRKISIPQGSKRHDVIELLRENDEAAAKSA